MIDRLAAIALRDVPRETIEKIYAYEALLRQESRRQNLIAASTLDSLWERHIIDSVQLVRFEPRAGASWVDVGSGAGLPGIIVSCIVTGPVTLVEPRGLRADFLHRVCDSLRLNASVLCSKVERTCGTFDVITARAVAKLGHLLRISQHLSTRNTVWVLPKGRTAREELAEAQLSWQGMFHVEQSVTDADSKIVVATGVRPKR